MNPTIRRVVAFAGAIALSFGAAACSSAEPPTTSQSGSATTPGATTASAEAGDILAKAKHAALAASSGAFKGEVDQNGSPMTIDFKGTTDGKQADLTVTANHVGGEIRFIAVKEGVYMQGDKAFWTKTGGAAAATTFAGKWVKAPSSFGNLTNQLSPKSILNKVFGSVSAAQLADTVGEETVNGVDCWVLTDQKGKSEGALYVSKARFELVRFTGTTARPGQLDFSQWNATVGIKGPAKNEIVPLA